LPNYSTFTADQNYQIDVFPTFSTLPASQYANATLYQQLKSLTNPTSEQITQINSLVITLQNYLVSTDNWNAFSQAVVNMEQLIKNVINFQDKGSWSSATTYDMFNTVYYNNQTYMSKQNTNLNHIPVGGTGDDWFSLVAKKGASFRPLSAWNSTTAYVNNIDYIDVVYSNGSAFYCIQGNTNQQPSQAYPPVDTSFWGVLSSRGVNGEIGQTGPSGSNLSFVGTYNPITSYDKDQCVQYSGSLYASLQDGITGFLPTDNTKWSLVVAQGASVLFTTLRRTVSVSTSVSNIQFLGGAITAFNPVNDSLLVYKNSTYIEQGQDYNINANGISIDKIGEGNWEGTVGVPITFNFVVIKNLIQSITWTDGSLIQAGSVTLDKMVQSVQDDINSISTISNEISVLNSSSALNLTSTQDASSRTTNITYTRSDASTYKTIDYSNFNSNDKPQTIVTKLYSSTSVLQTTNTATLVWSTDGSYVVSSSEVIS